LIFFWLKPSAEDRLVSLLHETLPADATVELESCDLSIVADQNGSSDGTIGLVHTVLRVDLRQYHFSQVTFLPGADRFTLRVGRKPVDDRMLAQAERVIDAGGDRTNEVFANRTDLRNLLNDKTGLIFFRVMAEVVDKDGVKILVAHEDAPEFHEFAQRVEALPPPVSFRSTTAYSAGTPSAESLLTGEILVVPFL
jgi:hypothetical protein